MGGLSYDGNFYPRSPCGERPYYQDKFSVPFDISIHALLAESDSERCRMLDLFIVFLSTLSLRRATLSRAFCSSDIKISIHALLAESDFISTIIICIVLKFLSTLSLRRATAKVHKTVGHFCAYETNFMEIASSC